MTTSKEYGKLTEDQFRRFIRKLPEFRRESDEFYRELRCADSDKLREIIGDGMWWAPLYELPFVHVVTLMIYAIGQLERLKIIAQLPDPQEYVLQEWEKLACIADEELVPKDVGKSDLIAIATALQRNILSVMIYKRSLCALIEEVREGQDDSVFDVVRIDRSAVSCPTIAARITEAELRGEKRFFLRLISAMKGPSRKHWEGYRDLRYSLAILRERLRPTDRWRDGGPAG